MYSVTIFSADGTGLKVNARRKRLALRKVRKLLRYAGKPALRHYATVSKDQTGLTVMDNNLAETLYQAFKPKGQPARNDYEDIFYADAGYIGHDDFREYDFKSAAWRM